jgi:hypothetical protein
MASTAMTRAPGGAESLAPEIAEGEALSGTIDTGKQGFLGHKSGKQNQLV